MLIILGVVIALFLQICRLNTPRQFTHNHYPHVNWQQSHCTILKQNPLKWLAFLLNKEHEMFMNHETMRPISSRLICFAQCENGRFSEYINGRKENITNNCSNRVCVQFSLDTIWCNQLHRNAIRIKFVLQSDCKIPNKYLKRIDCSKNLNCGEKSKNLPSTLHIKWRMELVVALNQMKYLQLPLFSAASCGSQQFEWL